MLGESIGGLAQALERFIAEWGYLAIFLLTFVEEAGAPLPLPSEAALLYVGYLASRGELDANLAGLVATAGCAGGATVLYGLARRGGRRLARRYGPFLHLTEAKLDRAERWVARRGAIAVPLSRLTPGLRTITTAVAGILRVPLRIVTPAILGVSLVWSFCWIYAGKLLGDNWEAGARAFAQVGRWGVVAAAALLPAGLLVYWLRSRVTTRRDKRPAPRVANTLQTER